MESIESIAFNPIRVSPIAYRVYCGFNNRRFHCGKNCFINVNGVTYSLTVIRNVNDFWDFFSGVKVQKIIKYKLEMFYWSLKGRVSWLLTEKFLFLFLLNVPHTLPDAFAKYQKARTFFPVWIENCSIKKKSFAFFLIPMSRIGRIDCS